MRKREEPRAWREALTLWPRGASVYEHVAPTERYGLCRQTRCAAAAVANRRSEGAARGGDAVFERFLNMARGPLSETKTQLWLTERRDFGTAPEIVSARIQRAFKRLGGLLKDLKARKTV